MTAIEIDTRDTSTVRIFALSVEDDEAKALKAAIDTDLAPGLGLNALDTNQLDLFAVEDLDEMTLADYLAEGYGITEEDLKPAAARLNALDGWVLVLRAAALPEGTARLAPAPSLTLIASLNEPATDWSEAAPLTSRAATEPRVRKPVSDAAMSGRIATFALLFIFLFTAIIVWIAA